MVMSVSCLNVAILHVLMSACLMRLYVSMSVYLNACMFVGLFVLTVACLYVCIILHTSPKTTCLPSSHSVFSVQMKN